MTFIGKIVENIVNPVIVFAFVVALVYFLYGVLTYVRKADDPAERSKAGQHILWGVVGLAIMLSAFGIVKFITNTFNLTDSGIIIQNLEK